MTQKEALDILKTGRNVFLTGAAGSGKTYVLNQYIKYLEELGAKFGITASTGIAATHMGGITIHSWSGIGVKDHLTKDDIVNIAEKRHVRRHVEKASILILDEISMLHHFRLDLIDKVIRKIKEVDEPFGGLQVVFCGDFFQLPPVRRVGEGESFFAYHSEAWKNLKLKICYLGEQHRQNDPIFLKILNAIRDNVTDEKISKLLETRLSPKSDFGQSVEATKLYTHNKNVDAENESELKKLPGQVFEYKMVVGKGNKNMIEALKKSCLAPETLRLKEGAKVMFVKNNFDEGYVNGTLGTVVKCSFSGIRVKTLSSKIIDVEKESWLIEEDNRRLAEISQYPLRLAWAITVHKSQGMSLDAALIDLSKSFEKGMGYVALSRVRSLEGLYLKGINNMALKVHDEVLEFDRKWRELSATNSFHIRTMDQKKVAGMHTEFAEQIKGAKVKEKKVDTVTQTKQMLDKGMNIKETAKARDLKPGTILDHLQKIKEENPDFNIYNLQHHIPKTKFRAIYSAFRKIGMGEGGIYRLAPVKEFLGPKYSYDDLRLVRLFL